MGLSQRQLFIVIIVAIISSDVLTMVIFLFSRGDPNLRVAALVGSGNVAVAFVAIASTLLTGKDLSGRKDPNDLPPGSAVQETTTVQTPPVTMSAPSSPNISQETPKEPQ